MAKTEIAAKKRQLTIAPRYRRYLKGHKDLMPWVVRQNDERVFVSLNRLFCGIEKKGPSSRKFETHGLRIFLLWCEDKGFDLTDLNSENIDRFASWVRGWYATSVASTVLSMGRRWFELLLELRVVEKNLFKSHSRTRNEPLMPAKYPTPCVEEPNTLPPLVRKGGKKAEAIFCQYARSFHDVYRLYNFRPWTPIWGLSEWCDQEIISLADLDERNVKKYLEYLFRRYAPTTAIRRVRAISRFFEALAEARVIRRNFIPRDLSRFYTRKEVRRGLLSSEQIKQILESFNEDSIFELRNRAILSIAYHVMPTLKEIMTLDVSDFRQTDDSWWFKVTDRLVPANELVCKHVLAYLGAGQHAAGPLIQSLKSRKSLSGVRLDRRDYNNFIRMLGERNGWANVCFTTFRQAGMRTYLKSGGTLEKLSLMTGIKIPQLSKYVPEDRSELIYEGELDGLIEFLGIPVESPLQGFVRKSGVFRLTVQTG